MLANPRIHVLLCTICFTIFSAALFGKNIPASVEAAFLKQYPQIKEVKWAKEKGNYEGQFMLNAIKTMVLYDKSGNLIQTEVSQPLNTLPVAISQYIQTNYPNKEIKEFSKITDPAGNITFEVEIKHLELLFKADGTFLRELKD